MSKSWSRGSSRSWRKIRAQVLLRDQYRCQLRLAQCTTIATTVHHTVAREVAGDDPAHLVAACSWCNQSTGDPRRHDPPAGKGRTQW